MSEARKRTPVSTGKAADINGPSSHPPTTKKHVNKDASSFRFTDVLRILGGLLLLNCALSYFVTNESVAWGWRPWFTKAGDLQVWMKGPIVLTDLELSTYDGRDPAKPLYIALNGTIYDVSAGRHFYGPGGSYSFFAGRDAARAFVTGCFDTDLTPDLRGAEETYVPVDPEDGSAEAAPLNKAELKVRKEREYRLARKRVADTLEGWAKMFRGEGGKDYFKVGEVKRAPGWLNRLPRRPLCERAQKQRPKRKVE